MTALEPNLTPELKSNGIKKIEYVNDGVESLSIFFKNTEPWIIPISPNFEETARLIDTLVDGQLNPHTKEELKNCIKENLSSISPHQYRVEQESNYEEWSSILREKYKNLQKITNDSFKGLWESLEFELSVQKILNIKDCTLPFAGIILGPSGGNKTLGLELFRLSKNVFYTDSFSARSFVSHSTSVKREDLEKIDLLPRIKDRFFLTPELSPLFGKKDEELMDTLSIITRIVDGHGFESDTGAHGHRGYPEDIMFTWIGASVDITWRVHKCLGTLGPKLYFFRLSLIEKEDDEYVNQMENDDFNIKLPQVRDVLTDYLEYFDRCPKSIIVNGLTKIQWDNSKDDKKTSKIILRLGKLLATLRALVTTYETEDTQGLGYGYNLANKEDPQRAMTQLRNLARSHALSQGRNYLTLQDMPLLIKVVFSTASIERVRIFELLREYNGKLTTSQIAGSLNMSNNTAKRTMAEFIAIGLVDLDEIENREKRITLKDKFDWFLSDDFQVVRKIPPYYSDLEEDKEALDNHNRYENERLMGVFSYDFTCYQCKFQTDSKSDYQTHWIKSGHPGSCYPGIADIERHGWERQGKEWEV